ncbi:antitoxin family protein [Methermicoccus shengliensis]|uniref:antitoxin family protein n=1 Tax=Methermicoccus shengliensis TaxID=660064 RepID=UPI000AE232E4|nr:antitoxin family protein [Methermicoccus shengliensis]
MVVNVKAIEVVYENGVFKPIKKVDLPEGIKLTVLVEEFGEIDEISNRVKNIAGEASREKIIEILGEAWV